MVGLFELFAFAWETRGCHCRSCPHEDARCVGCHPWNGLRLGVSKHLSGIVFADAASEPRRTIAETVLAIVNRTGIVGW